MILILGFLLFRCHGSLCEGCFVCFVDICGVDGVMQPNPFVYKYVCELFAYVLDVVFVCNYLFFSIFMCVWLCF